MEAFLDPLIWSGAAATLFGIAALIWCIATVLRARRARLADDELRDRLRRVLPVNLAALFLSVIGLMMVVVGVLLG